MWVKGAGLIVDDKERLGNNDTKDEKHTEEDLGNWDKAL